MTERVPAAQQPRHPWPDGTGAARLGVLVNLPLAVLKVLAGVLGGSQALIADGILSTSDLLGLGQHRLTRSGAGSGSATDRLAGPSRHSAVATPAKLANLAIALALIACSGVFIWHAMQVLAGEAKVATPGLLALAIAVASLVLKALLFWYTLRVARRAQSPLIEANAWQHRSGVLSSVIAASAIVSSMCGVPGADAIGAALIALMLAAIGARHLWTRAGAMIDTGLSPERLTIANDLIHTVPGVLHVARLRSHRIDGARVSIEVDVCVDSRLHLTEAQRTARAIRAQLMNQMAELGDAYVHVSPDGAPTSEHLPLRQQILPELRQAWGHLTPASAITHVSLRYAQDAIDVHIWLPLIYAQDDRSHQHDFDAAVARLPVVGRVCLHYTAALLNGNRRGG